MSQAGERTEEATPRRLEKAREDGKIISSRQMVVAVQFIVGFYYFQSADEEAAAALHNWKAWLAAAFDNNGYGWQSLQLSMAWTQQILMFFVWSTAATSGAIFLSQMAVSQGYFSVAKAKPDFSKLFNMGRLAGQFQEGMKSVVISLVVLVAFCLFFSMYWRESIAWSAFLARLSLHGQWSEQLRQIISIGKLCCLMLVIVGGADYLLNMRKFNEDLKMTKQELKEEYKEGNGNPEVKAKIRRIMKEFAGKRMMAQVPKATVVITNPTHYAIAIRYEAGEMAVPLVLAKGVDHAALRIRKVALEHHIPIIENPPLAQALYKSVEPGQEIPMHLYRAVAEVLAYVYRILGRTAAR